MGPHIFATIPVRKGQPIDQQGHRSLGGKRSSGEMGLRERERERDHKSISASLPRSLDLVPTATAVEAATDHILVGKDVVHDAEESVSNLFCCCCLVVIEYELQN